VLHPAQKVMKENDSPEEGVPRRGAEEDPLLTIFELWNYTWPE
jgi:hypothetical protein